MPNVFEINEDEMNKKNVLFGFYAIFFSFFIKEKLVGPVKILQDQ